MFERLRGERDPSTLVHAILRRWWVVALVAVIAAAGAYEFSKHKQKQYQATASLLFTNSQLDQLALGKNVVSSGSDPTRDAATNHALLTLPKVAQLVASQLHISKGRVISDVTIGSDSTSNVVSVTVTDPSPSMAAAIANAYVSQYKTFRKQTDRAQLTDAEALVSSQLQASAGQPSSSTYQRLLSEQQSLQLLASLQTGNADVVQQATVPHSPTAPVPSRDAVIGLLLGLLVGLGLVVLLERGDRRIKTAQELEELYRVPVIGTVPDSKALRGSRAYTASGHEQEAFRMMYAQLRYVDLDQEVRRVIVTSAESEEGKSTVALNLARAAASTGDKRVLLIEGDMRRPSLMYKLGVHELAGLGELLLDSHDLATGLRELVIRNDGADESGSGTPNLDVLLAGRLAENSADLLSGRRMSELLAVADDLYDLILVDTPPIGLVSDPIALIHQVDGVIVVGRLGWSHRDRAPRLMKQLHGLNANILGVVINGVQQGLGYYYGYTPATEAPRRERVPRPRRNPSKTP